MPALIAFPRFPIDSERRYRLSSREKTTFHTVLDAKKLLDPTGEHPTSVKITAEPDAVRLAFEYPLARGRISEILTLRKTNEGLVSDQLVRSVFNTSATRVRHEETDFSDDTMPLPPQTYPEVALPFLLGWQPLDGKVRDLYAWINDRFVARVEYLSKGKVELELPRGRVPAIKVIMYPDFNDWVRLGKVLTKLSRPFAPKYNMWFAPEPPHQLLRFEGPYGPPGAPEVVMELI